MATNDFSAVLLAERKKLLEMLRGTEFTKLDPAFTHRQVIPLASYSPWYDDKEFLTLYESARQHTLVDIYRCYELWTSVRALASLRGDILEVGVWRGGTGAILCSACKGEPSTNVFLADTFSGVVKAGSEDTNYKGGEHADTSEAVVQSLLSGLQLKNFHLLKGIFPDDIPTEIQFNDIKFCHIDVDTYQSALDLFEFVWPKLVTGGMLIFDDYGFWGCEGITRLVNNLQLENARFIHNLNGHAILIKIAAQ